MVSNTPCYNEYDVLHIEENKCFRLTLRTDEKKLECTAKYEDIAECFSCQKDSSNPNLENRDQEPSSRIDLASPPPPTEPNRPTLTREEFIRILTENKIVTTVDFEAVTDFCDVLRHGKIPAERVIARGIPPRHGKDGWMEFYIKTFGTEIELHEDESGKIDHHALNTYTTIDTGQKLARVHTPKPGIAGMTIQGEEIPGEDGIPYELNVGDGTEGKYNGRLVYATKSGYAVFNNQTLSVVNQWTIPGNVDLTIGDINFDGLVEIRGEVPDDFDIRATKGLKVTGTVGACQIESDGPIDIHSMAGKGLGSIFCRGNLKAKFLNQVTVICHGDVIVTNEIRNCTIKSTGRIIVERGSIIGGKCIALAGIEAQIVGAPSGQLTALISGVFFPDMDRFNYLNTRKTQISQQIKSINEAIIPLKKLIEKSSNIAETAQKRLYLLQEQLEKLQLEKQQTFAELKSSAPQTREESKAQINITRSLMEGVEITLGNAYVKTRSAQRGPLSIIENCDEEELSYITLKPLN